MTSPKFIISVTAGISMASIRGHIFSRNRRPITLVTAASLIWEETIRKSGMDVAFHSCVEAVWAPHDHTAPGWRVASRCQAYWVPRSAPRQCYTSYFKGSGKRDFECKPRDYALRRHGSQLNPAGLQVRTYLSNRQECCTPSKSVAG